LALLTIALPFLPPLLPGSLLLLRRLAFLPAAVLFLLALLLALLAGGLIFLASFFPATSSPLRVGEIVCSNERGR
jgi:hypothetical protein